MGQQLEQEWEQFREELWVEGDSLWPGAQEWPLLWDKPEAGEILPERRKAGNKRKKKTSWAGMVADTGIKAEKTGVWDRPETTGSERLLAWQGDKSTSPGAQGFGDVGEHGDVLKEKGVERLAALGDNDVQKGTKLPLAESLRESGAGRAVAEVGKRFGWNGGALREKGLPEGRGTRNSEDGPEGEDREEGVKRLGAVTSWNGADWHGNGNALERERETLEKPRQRNRERYTALERGKETRYAAGKNEDGGMPAVQVVLEKVELRQEADLDRLIRQIGEEMQRAIAAGREGGI